MRSVPTAAPKVREERDYAAWLAASLAVAAFFLFFRLSAHDPLTDEEELAFRALGYLDFLNAAYQTTPYEWFERPPWWVGLSFHDHPPLVFLMQHLVLRWLGDSLLAIRLPFALLGLASLILLGETARRLYGPAAAGIVVALTAVNTYWLWVFRLGLQEGLVVFFLVAGLYCLTRAGEARPWWLVAWGITAGLAMLTKYTSILSLGAALLYMLLLAPSLLRRKELAVGVGCAALLFSPVVIYNLELYRAVGHFDLQLATVLGQATPQWTILPGKAIGTLADRLTSFLPNLWWNAGWPFVLLLAVSLLVWLIEAMSRRRQPPRQRADVFVLSCLVLAVFLVCLVGASERFLVLLVPFALLFCGGAMAPLLARRSGRAVASAVLAAVLGLQALVSFQTLHAVGARPTPSATVTALRSAASAWGYAELEEYLRGLLDAARPAVSLGLPARLAFIDAVRARNWRHTGGEKRARLIVYDPRMNNVAKVWLFDRRYFYDGWPILSADDYEEVRRVHPGLFTEMGISEYYYVVAAPGLYTAGNTSTSPGAAAVAARLAPLTPERSFVSPAGLPTFTVYRSGGPL